MLSSLLRPRKARRRTPPSFNSSSPYAQRSSAMLRRPETTEDVRHAQADWTETEGEDDDSEEDNPGEDHGEAQEEEDEEDEGEDGASATPLLPIFSAAHLGKSNASRSPSSSRLPIFSRLLGSSMLLNLFKVARF